MPCVKLRAVVDAAKEISQLDSEERSVFPETFFDGKVSTPKVKTLGADDFLPIFIFCFVQAKIERPSALCKLVFRFKLLSIYYCLTTLSLYSLFTEIGELLSVMCDPAKLNGEVRTLFSF